MHTKLWLLSLITAGLLLGCSSQQPAPEPETIPQQDVVEAVSITPELEPTFDLSQGLTTDAAPVEDTISFTLETVTHNDSVYAPDDDSVLLARYDYYLPYLQVIDETNAQACAVADSFNAQFSMWEEANGFDEMVTWAQENYALNLEQGIDWLGHYQSELSTTPFQTTGYISICGEYYSFTGGAHGNTVLVSWLFDLNTATFISPLSLATDPQAFSTAVAELLIAQVQEGTLEGYPLEELYWDDYQTVLSTWDSYCVYFDDDGMHIAFSPYELAAYAAGAQSFVLDYQTITPYLSEQALVMLNLI
ncbi:DUF3298 domain-containing protein [Bengtsoniella intestinalis]|uniref:DUF3298 and DUF4163 domain-containing protein n=1 Tax=Bengtsoniella intestinalis TaxID=3073143 RepID=UPI00391F3469